MVVVKLGAGRFEPRSVSLGNRSENYVEVLEGVAEGEQVVISANFLIDAESNLKAALSGLGSHVGSTPATGQKQRDASKQPATAVGHRVQGTLNAVNADSTVSVTHGPVEALGWPGMTMDFALAHSALAAGIKPGAAISFEIVERQPGEWVITRLQTTQANPHEGH